MSEEEVIGEAPEDIDSRGSEDTDYFVEDVEVEGLSILDVELFLSRAEIWDNLLQNKISINEAQNILSSLGQTQIEVPKTSTKRSGKRKS